MIKVIHFADFHLGMDNYGHIDTKTGLSTRALDFLASLDFLVEHALAHDTDIVLFAGDAFKTRSPSPTHQREFASRIRRLSAAGVQTVLLVGNHDLPVTMGKAHTLEIFRTLNVPNVIVADRPGLHQVPARSGEFLQVLALPWVLKSHILAKDKYKGLGLTELGSVMRQRLVELLITGTNSLSKQARTDRPLVLLAHGTVEGAVFGSEQDAMLGNDLIIPRDIAFSPIFDYVAMGHLHKHQQVGEDPPVVYAGSMERVDFGEARDPKGFVELELGVWAGLLDWRFVETPTRDFVTLDVAVEEDEDADRAVVKAVGGMVKLADVILRINVSGAGLLNEGLIRAAAAAAANVSIRNVRPRGPARLRLAADGDLRDYTPEQLLKHYFVAKGTPKKRAEMLMGLAKEIIEEVDNDTTE